MCIPLTSLQEARLEAADDVSAAGQGPDDAASPRHAEGDPLLVADDDDGRLLAPHGRHVGGHQHWGGVGSRGEQTDIRTQIGRVATNFPKKLFPELLQ